MTDFESTARSFLASSDLSRVRADDLARHCNMSCTTMRRRLRTSGATWSRLVDAERQTRCQRILQERGRRAYGKVMQSELGYSELNSFYRAFRRWYGTPFVNARTQA